MTRPGGLTDRQRRFVEEYLLDCNGAAAVRRAGYAARDKRRAAAQAQRLLKSAAVAVAIDAAMAARAKRVKISQDRVVEELARIAFANAGDYFEWGPEGVRLRPQSALHPHQQAVVQEVTHTRTAAGGTVKLKLADKQKALELLGRHLGLFKERDGERDKPPPAEALDDETLARRIRELSAPETQTSEPDPITTTDIRNADLPDRSGGGPTPGRA